MARHHSGGVAPHRNTQRSPRASNASIRSRTEISSLDGTAPSRAGLAERPSAPIAGALALRRSRARCSNRSASRNPARAAVGHCAAASQSSRATAVKTFSANISCIVQESGPERRATSLRRRRSGRSHAPPESHRYAHRRARRTARSPPSTAAAPRSISPRHGNPLANSASASMHHQESARRILGHRLGVIESARLPQRAGAART